MSSLWRDPDYLEEPLPWPSRRTRDWHRHWQDRIDAEDLEPVCERIEDDPDAAEMVLRREEET